MSSAQCLALVCRYWRDIAAGWRPSLSEDRCVGPHDPFDNGRTRDLGARTLVVL